MLMRLRILRHEHTVLAGDSTSHTVIEGENLHALMALEEAGTKVDFVYIDPPYNTSADAKYADTFTTDYWLSMMERRLRLAWKMLHDEGAIWIQIGMNESHHLRMLCDQIFGASNFATTVTVEMSSVQGMKVRAAQQGGIVKTAEFIHIYTKPGRPKHLLKPLYNERGFDQNYSRFLTEISPGRFEARTLVSAVQSEKKWDGWGKHVVGKLNMKKLGLLWDSDVTFRRWMFENSYRVAVSSLCPKSIEADTEMNEGAIKTVTHKGKRYVVWVNGGGKVSQWITLESNLKKRGNDYVFTTVRGDLWKGFQGEMINLNKEGNVKFKNGKKPLKLMKDIISTVCPQEGIVLDFFGGSGSTLHSVMELNKREGATRTCITITSDESNICRDVLLKRVENIGHEYTDRVEFMVCDLVDG